MGVRALSIDAARFGWLQVARRQVGGGREACGAGSGSNTRAALLERTGAVAGLVHAPGCSSHRLHMLEEDGVQLARGYRLARRHSRGCRRQEGKGQER